MPNDSQGQVPNATAGQVPATSGQTPPVTPPTPSEGQEPELEQFTADYVKKLRAEAADYRKKLRELEAQVKSEADAKLTDAEKLNKRLADLERQQADAQRERQERTTRYEVMLAAGKVGIVDPEAAYRLLDLKVLEFDDEGNPQNVEAALGDLLKAKPFLAGTPMPAGGASTNPAAGRATRLTRDDIKKMSPEEINRRWDEVQAVLSGK